MAAPAATAPTVALHPSAASAAGVAAPAIGAKNSAVGTAAAMSTATIGTIVNAAADTARDTGATRSWPPSSSIPGAADAIKAPAVAAARASTTAASCAAPG